MAYTSRAITRFGGTSNVSSAAGLTTTINLPASIPIDSVIIAVVTYNGPVSVTTPTGFTLINKYQQQSSATFKGSTVIFAKYADGTEGASVSATTTTSLDWASIVQVYQGATRNDGSPVAVEFIVGEAALGEDNAAADTTVTTGTANYTASDYGLWRFTHFNEISTAGNTWTSTDTERADVTSSGTVTKTSSAFYDSNAAVSSGTSTNKVGTSSNSLGGARIAWCGLLRVGKGGTQDDVTVPTDSRVLTRNPIKSDNVVPTDSSSKSQTKGKTDSEALTDALVNSRQKTSTDTEALSDTRAFSRTSAPTDSPGVVDTRAFSQSHVYADSEPLADPVTKTRDLIKSDTEDTSDTRVLSQQKSPSDPGGLTDTQAKTRQSTASDTEPLTDSKVGSQQKIRSDPEALSDSKVASQTKSPTDTEGLLDYTARSQTAARQDLQGLTDLGAKSFQDVDVDSSGLLDTRNIGRGFGVQDLEGLTDFILAGPFDQLHIVGSGGGSGGKTYILDIADGMSFSDGDTLDGGHETVSRQDLIYLSDSTSMIFADDHRTYVLDFRDSTGLSDFSSRSGGHTALSFTDPMYVGTSTEIFSLDEDTAGTYSMSVSDSMMLPDTGLTSGGTRLTVQDSFVLSDQGLEHLTRLNRSIQDRMRLRDSIVITHRPQVQAFSDRVRLRDTHSVELIPPGTAARSIGETKR